MLSMLSKILGLYIFLLFFVGVGLAIAGLLMNEQIMMILGLIVTFIFSIPLIIHLHTSYITKKIEKAREFTPVYTSPAKVISKTSQILWGFISFELSDGNRRNFTVSIEQFNLISENDIGILSYKEQGDHLFLIDFQRQS